MLEGLSAGAFEREIGMLGDVVVRTSVELQPGVSTYLCRPDAVPLHTDHPDIDLVACWCERQDTHDGALLLVDTRDVLAALDERARARLRRVRLPRPELRGLTSANGTRSCAAYAG